MKKSVLKKSLSIFAILALILTFSALPAYAAGSGEPLVVDKAELLSDSEEQALEAQLQEISDRQQLELVVMTTPSTYGKSVTAFADDYWDQQGYGYGDEHDGAMFLISMEERDWYISTCGFGITAFTDAGIQYIGEQVTGYLSDGDYAGGLSRFAEAADEFVTQAKTGEPYDKDNLPKETMPLGMRLGIGGILGLIVGFFRSGGAKSQLRSKVYKPGARAYIAGENIKGHPVSGFSARGAGDIFLYYTISRALIRDDDDRGGGGGSSIHMSSGGVTHGGGGGKF